MPTITIQLCPKCRKKKCDGAVWEEVKIVEEGQDIDLTGFSKDNLIGCSMDVLEPKHFLGKNVGDTVVIPRPNWCSLIHKDGRMSKDLFVTYKKIEA